MSLTAFKARNHPQQVTRDDVDDRRTPSDLFDRLHAEHGFTLDAAASDDNALLAEYCSIERSGLDLSWDSHVVWCNPPYSGIRPWIAKAWRAMILGDCKRVVMLLPANRCEQRFWQEEVEPYRDGPVRQGVTLRTHFIGRRVRFNGPDGERIRSSKNSGPPFGCVLLTWERAA